MKTDNELIAEFMGFPAEYQDLKFTGGYETKKRKVKYDTSWDWLMPVVEKITNIYCKDIENNWTHEEGRKFNSVLDIKLSVASTPDSDYENEGIDFVHYKVVEFIKWYNEQKKP